MDKEKITITVYGAEQICASCIGAPGSKDTYEWLQAAISRKYMADIDYEYVDIFAPPADARHKNFAARVLEEDLFYPIVFVDEKIVAEGIPRLKTIYQELDRLGAALKL